MCISLTEGYCYVRWHTVQPEGAELVTCFVYSTMKMEAVRSSGTWHNFCLTIWHHKSECHCCENLKPSTSLLWLTYNCITIPHPINRYLSVAGKVGSADLASALCFPNCPYLRDGTHLQRIMSPKPFMRTSQMPSQNILAPKPLLVPPEDAKN